MKKATVLKVINPLLALALIVQVLSVILQDQMDYELFHTLHTIGGAGLVFGSAIHFFLNWGWVRNSYFKKRSN